MASGTETIRRLSRAAQRVRVSLPAQKKKPRKPGSGDSAAAVPVEPDRPRDLSGGAAAALEFDA